MEHKVGIAMLRVHFLVLCFKERNIIASRSRQQKIEKLTVVEELNEFSAFNGTQILDTVFIFVTFDENKPLYGNTLQSKLNSLHLSNKI
jgi:hypothetical protein